MRTARKNVIHQSASGLIADTSALGDHFQDVLSVSVQPPRIDPISG